MSYREFVRSYMATHRPRSPAEARRLMRQAAAAWRRRGRNPHELSEGFATGLGAGVGVAIAMIGAGLILSLLTRDKGCWSC